MHDKRFVDRTNGSQDPPEILKCSRIRLLVTPDQGYREEGPGSLIVDEYPQELAEGHLWRDTGVGIGRC